MEAVDPLGRRPPPSQEQFGMVDGEVAVELTETRGRDEPAALTAPRARVAAPPAWLFFVAGVGPSWIVLNSVFLEVALMHPVGVLQDVALHLIPDQVGEHIHLGASAAP